MTPSPAYSDGYLACRAGTPLSRNPFADTPRSFHPAHDDWRRGWLKAEADIDAENVERQFREPRP